MAAAAAPSSSHAAGAEDPSASSSSGSWRPRLMARKQQQQQQKQQQPPPPSGAEEVEADDALVDALPYVDAIGAEAAWRPKVDQLIKDEMAQSGLSAGDYLRALPPPHKIAFPHNAILRAEWERVCQRKKMRPLEGGKYRSAAAGGGGGDSMEQPPLARRNDPQAWEEAIAQGQAGLEHQAMRNLNLELMAKYASNSWRACMNQLESTQKRLQRLEEATDQKIDTLNRKRKAAQMDVWGEMKRLTGKWRDSVTKCNQIEVACRGLEEEIEGLEQAVQTSGGGQQE